jgi:hypothetical protein
MLRIRRAWPLAALAALGFAACKKDDKPADKASDQKSVDKSDKKDDGKKDDTKSDGKKATESTVLAATPSTTASAEDLALIPNTSELVMGINVAQLQTSSVWKKYAEPKLAQDEAAAKLREFKDKCGFDPLVAIKSMAIGVRGLPDKPEGVAVVHGLEKSKMLPCIDKTKGDDDVSHDGDLTFVKGKNGTQFGIKFIDDTTMLVVVGAQVGKDALEAAAKGKSALKSTPAFISMYNKLNANDTLWGLIRGDSKILESAAAAGLSPKGVFGSINASDGITADVKMRLGSPDEAAKFVTGLGAQAKGLVQSYVDSLELANDNDDVVLAIKIGDAKLDNLITLAKRRRGP